LVAFKEIPQRELRELNDYVELKKLIFCCIQRNPRKGIERLRC
jgi:hypothetical protein